ncbi:MAG: hypothetical protein ACYTHJ_17040 [Planctomycetota bacterium]|jgi:hypothetical protein
MCREINGGTEILRTDGDGNNLTVILEQQAVVDVLNNAFPTKTSGGFLICDDMAVDGQSQKIYWQNWIADPNDLPFKTPVLMRSGLDGNGIEIFFVGTPSLAPEFLPGINVVHPTGAAPALGAWGLGIMCLLVLGAGSVVFRRGLAPSIQR